MEFMNYTVACNDCSTYQRDVDKQTASEMVRLSRFCHLQMKVIYVQ